MTTLAQIPNNTRAVCPPGDRLTSTDAIDGQGTDKDRKMLDFMLNGQRYQLGDIAPEATVLNVLRTNLMQCGTKEGCASGDCGACTVAIGETTQQGVRYSSANACITPAHQLQGRQLITVEGLAAGKSLHPVQQAMVEHHGSQCGFCTPGIVMSLFCLYHNHTGDQPPSDAAIAASLGGNLCRCTGYRPIREAARHMMTSTGHIPTFLTRTAEDRLRQNDDGPYRQPTSLIALKHALRDMAAARLVAGGTDLMLETTLKLERFEQLIDVSRVAELLEVEETTDGWWIGAAVTYSRLEPLLAPHYPSVAELLERLGSRQIRNRGTLGGNIANASPIGDTPPVLLALDATVKLDGIDGERTLPLDDFFIDYKRTALKKGEFIRAIWLPRPGSEQRLHVWKLSKRREDDISALLMAIRYRLEAGVLRNVRLAFGGMAATPKRALATERALEGSRLDTVTLDAARAALSEDFDPIDDVRASRGYRLEAAGNLLERLHWQLTRPDTRIPTTLLEASEHAHLD